MNCEFLGRWNFHPIVQSVATRQMKNKNIWREKHIVQVSFVTLENSCLFLIDFVFIKSTMKRDEGSSTGWALWIWSCQMMLSSAAWLEDGVSFYHTVAIPKWLRQKIVKMHFCADAEALALSRATKHTRKLLCRVSGAHKCMMER